MDRRTNGKPCNVLDSVKLQWSLKARALMYADKPRQYEEVRGLMVKRI